MHEKIRARGLPVVCLSSEILKSCELNNADCRRRSSCQKEATPGYLYHLRRIVSKMLWLRQTRC